ncbi:CDP-diacylglycerol-glycerol-3-phosphate 3-phosphatidyltransferase [Cutibacterium acnes JCM 18920]|nr:CDP-diacylglycerol-glycerol-3-phosphate 3-phosphatidyltransferase [Cutibacterium acnes JCM 18920]
MARKLGRHSQWGSFLDSTLDRFGDAAIFTGVALYFAGPGNSVLWTAMACAALVFGMATSYVRAKLSLSPWRLRWVLRLVRTAY